MEVQLEQLRQEVEVDLGRPMSVCEEVETKALFYFAKGVELKNELERRSKDRHRRRVVSRLRV